MPRTADALPGHEAFGERPVIVAAMRANRKNLRARTHQQHFIVADMAEQRLISEFGQAYAFCQIGTGGWCCLIGHIFLRCVFLRSRCAMSPFPEIPDGSARCRESSPACGW